MTDAPELVEDLMAQAIRLHQEGQLRDAGLIYQRVLELAPDHCDALHLFGLIAHQIGQPDTAVSFIRRAILSNPTIPLFYFNLGLILNHTGKLEDAQIAYETACTLNPEYLEAHYGLAINHLGLNNPAAAIPALKRVVEIHPAHQEAQHLLSQLLFEAGEDRAALNHYRAAHQTSAADLYTVASVTAWCQQGHGSLQPLGDAEEIVVPNPAFIGERFDAVGGVTHSNPLYVAELKQARIFSKSDVILADEKTALHDMLAHPLGHIVDLRFDSTAKLYNTDKILVDYSGYQTQHADCGIMLCGSSTHVYGHWLAEHLPKLKLFDSLPKYADYPVYVDANMPENHYQILALINQGNRKIIRMPEKTCIAFERLLIASAITFFPFACKPGTKPCLDIAPTSFAACQFLRDKVLSSLNLDASERPAGKRGRYIYLGRLSSGRKLINEEELKHYLTQCGFEIIYPEQLSFAEQVQLFNEAEYVIGPNGSSFAGVIFSKPGTKVVSLAQHYGANFASWAWAVEQLEHIHLYVAGSAIPDSSWHEHHLSYTVPLDLVKQALRKLGFTQTP